MDDSDVSGDVFDVAIVGYGPTGLALASWLGKAGHNIVVIERWPDLYKLPRAGHVDASVMRLFQRMGVADQISRDSSMSRHTIILDREGVQLAKMISEESDQGWHSHYSLFQPNLERTLDTGVRTRGNVTILQGWQVERLDTSVDEAVRIHVASGDESGGNWICSGAEKVISARWLIGSDGANSVVRKTFDSEVRDLGYQARAVVIFAERLDPEVGASMPDIEIGMVLPRPYVALRESGKRFARWEFYVHDDETSAEMSEASKAWELIQRWGFNPGNARLVRHSVFEFRTLIVEDWREGNVLLAGDAAHVMPPFQGQGMCSGQRDAAGLAWRLDLVLRGVADAVILDSYTQERKPHVLQLTKNASERGQAFWVTDPEQARQRDEQMKQGLLTENMKKNHGDVPPLSDGFLMRGPDGIVLPAGQLSAQFPVKYSGKTALLDDYVGANWLLLSTDRSLLEALRDGETAILEILRSRIFLVGAEETQDGFGDIDGRYTQYMRELDCKMLLIRPDCYIFGGASEVEGVHALFTSLDGQLHLKKRAFA